MLAELISHRDMLENKNAVSDRLESLYKAVKALAKRAPEDWKKKRYRAGKSASLVCREEENV